MSNSNAAKEAAAIAVAGLGNAIGLHTADPGATGANEATGGSPAYVRKATTWTNGPSDGVVAGDLVEFDAPAGTYTHFSIWSATGSGGTFVTGGALSPQVTLSAQGKVRVTPTLTAS